MNSFDLILLYTVFRKHDFYINIVKGLATKYRVGMLPLSESPLSPKIARTNAAYYQDCLQLGAQEVQGEARTRLLLFPRLGGSTPAKAETLIRSKIQYDQLLLTSPGPFHGIMNLEEIIQRFGPATILAQDLSRFGEYEPESKQIAQRLNCPVIEAGSPYKRHPIFTNFKTDYLVAYPGALSVGPYSQLYWILREIKQAIDELPSDAVVYVKPHNVRDDGSFVSDPGLFQYLALPRPIFSLLINLFDKLVRLPLGDKNVYDVLPNVFLGRLNRLVNAYIQRFSINVIKTYPAYGVEQFLPGVRQGVISGLGNTIWEALYQNIPTKVIDHLPLETRPPQFKMYWDSFQLKDWNGYATDLAFNTISESSRRANLVQYIETCLIKEDNALVRNYGNH